MCHDARPLNWQGYIPIAITITRTALMLPFAVILLSEDASLYAWAMLLWSIAALLDVADGLVARELNAVTEIGAMMDLVADRIMIVVALLLLAILRAANPYLVLLIVTRELLVDSIRAWRLVHGVLAPHNIFGQLKMATIVIAILCALAGLGEFLPRRPARLITDGRLAFALIVGCASVIRVWRAEGSF